MNSAVLVALISFAGTLLGTAGGIIASSKLTTYRLEQLERKVDAHAQVASKIPVIEEKIKTINRRIAKIERENISEFCGVN